MVIYATVCHIIKDDRILLIKKRQDLFGGGKWNGLGGKMNPDESPEETCRREVLEESGLTVGSLQHHGLLKFWFGGGNEPNWIVHVFSTHLFEGQLRESREGTLHWTQLDQIPYNEMWEDDQHWLPLLLNEKTFSGEFYFNKEGTKLLEYNIIEVKE
jgi:8-oxo-dGTP diphosphatase